MGKFDKYKIDLKGMQTDSAKYEFVLDNLYFAHIDGPEVQKGKVNVTLTVKRTSRAFELSFQTDGMVWVPCLLYTSPSPRDRSLSRMPSSA